MHFVFVFLFSNIVKLLLSVHNFPLFLLRWRILWGRRRNLNQRGATASKVIAKTRFSKTACELLLIFRNCFIMKTDNCQFATCQTWFGTSIPSCRSWKTFSLMPQIYWTIIKMSINFSQRIAWSLLTAQTHSIDDQSICSWLNRDYEGLNFFFLSLLSNVETYKLDRKTVDDGKFLMGFGVLLPETQ